MCRAAPRASASERKKCGTSSVGNSPTRSRLKRPSHTKKGRPEMSSATCASASSLATNNPYLAMLRLFRGFAPRFAQRGSQSQGAVLDGVVLVDVQIAAASQFERKAAMLRDLFQHVIEESQAGGDCAGALAR